MTVSERLTLAIATHRELTTRATALRNKLEKLIKLCSHSERRKL